MQNTPSTRPETDPRPDPMDRRAWHRTATRPVAVWLVGLVVLAFVHRWVPQSRWLLVHMFTLGMVTNSILVWGQHFTDALLRNGADEAGRRLQVRRIMVLNLGIALTATGMVGEWHWITVAGATVVGSTLAWYAVSLLSQVRSALPARFTPTVRFYAVAAMLLPLGAVFGGFMSFSQPEPWQGRLLLAHLFSNVGGFVGLTAVGTLVTLWPTVLRTKMEPAQDVAGRRALWTMLVSVLVGVVGALAGLRWLAGLAVLGYLAGLAIIYVPLVRCAVRKSPRDFPAYSIGAALVWLPAGLVWLAWKLFSTPRDLVAADVQGGTIALVAGFGAQLLFGAMSYLMPTVMGGGPSVVRAACAEMNRFGALRVAALNAALVTYLATDNSWTRALTSLIAFASLSAFVPLVVRMVKASVAARKAKAAAAAAPTTDAVAAPATSATPGAAHPAPKTQPAPKTHPAPKTQPAPGRRDLLEAAVGIGAVWGAAKLGQRMTTGGTTSTTSTKITPTGDTTTVDVHAAGMRFDPETVDVPLGDRLVINLVNDDPTMVHDLYLDSGATSGRVAPGASASVDAGVIAGPVEGWCTIVGHRAAGMVFHVTADGTSASGSGSSGASSRVVVDLTQAPGDDFQTRDAVLPAIATATTKALTLTVQEAVQEVAPGWTQVAMTYNGRVMGPVIGAHIGDTIDCHLANEGTMGHSIDFHAGTVSPDENMRTIEPGESLDYRFRVNRAGIWLYHCSTMPMSSHIAAGMYGAVVVPPKGIARAAREYVLVQQELYLGNHGEELDASKIADERPDLAAWNGHANQYVFAPLTAKVGERVRIWVLCAGPSRGVSFHVVGTQFDTVFKEGAYLLRPGNAEGGGAQALDLSAAQGGFVEMVFEEAGTYTFVNHSFVEMERGARGLIKVT